MHRALMRSGAIEAPLASRLDWDWDWGRKKLTIITPVRAWKFKLEMKTLYGDGILGAVTQLFLVLTSNK